MKLTLTGILDVSIAYKSNNMLVPISCAPCMQRVTLQNKRDFKNGNLAVCTLYCVLLCVQHYNKQDQTQDDLSASIIILDVSKAVG